ncbi:MAG: hypothetical protein AB7S48_13290 [Bacteroidales bacterium]
MKKIFILIVLFAFVGTGCKFMPGYKKKQAAIEAAKQKAKQDSIQKAQAFESEKIRMAQEKARQDSLAKVQEYEAKFRFHVIIGSFKVPSNATGWEQEVHGMGYNNTKILHASNGFDLVSIAAYDTYSKAFNEIERINADKEEPLELWIYENI